MCSGWTERYCLVKIGQQASSNAPSFSSDNLRVHRAVVFAHLTDARKNREARFADKHADAKRSGQISGAMLEIGTTTTVGSELLSDLRKRKT